ncbi:ribonucleotide reductase inhibitor-domain-containing protein [Diaporthe sp. PMI_573]|nr:ribonucleotide reductase inhibitor-domain-containing protein [Diaporthaceae sp. PMI_573]
MSAPRTKRQFAGSASDPSQRQITSFFSASDALDDSSTSACAEASLSSRPVLPADTQSHLLNVGMRVRKSVPEGYKTGSYNAFSLWSDNDATTKLKDMAGPAPAPARAPPSASSQQELLPFCGINKVGGLSSQPGSARDAPAIPVPRLQLGSIPSIDDVPSLTSSQGSIDSNSSQPALTINTASTASRKKRVYSEDEDSDTPSVTGSLQVPGGPWMDGEVSPRSLVPVGWDNTNTRVMAIPKKGRGAAMPLRLDQLGQENMAVDGDFQEADFLDYKALAHDAMDI